MRKIAVHLHDQAYAASYRASSGKFLTSKDTRFAPSPRLDMLRLPFGRLQCGAVQRRMLTMRADVHFCIKVCFVSHMLRLLGLPLGEVCRKEFGRAIALLQ
jgi:hypothetical protein